jgi:hypothetical protein
LGCPESGCEGRSGDAMAELWDRLRQLWARSIAAHRALAVLAVMGGVALGAYFASPWFFSDNYLRCVNDGLSTYAFQRGDSPDDATKSSIEDSCANAVGKWIWQ